MAPSATGGPRQGGDLIFTRARDVTSLDPAPVGDTDTIYSLNQMYETLYQVGPDGDLVPWLATGYELSDDQLSWTFHLRPGVSFHDGTPMTSADVKFSIDRGRGDETSFNFIDAAIDRVETPDAETVVIRTRYPWAPLLADLAGFINYVLPNNFGGKTAEEFFAKPVGTGPFMFDHWTKGQELKLVRNSNYWQEGLPYLDSVIWKPVADENTRVLQLKGGQSHIDQDPPFSSIADINATTGLVATIYPVELTTYVLFNTTVKPLDDVHVRRAIAYAIDRQGMVDAILFGNGEVANSFIAPQMQYHDPATPGIQFDLAKAKEELAQSSVPDGFSIEFLTPGDNKTFLSVAEIVQQNLKEIGITVTLRKIEFTNLYPEIAKYNYQMTVEGWGSDIPDPDEQVSFMCDYDSAGSYSTGYKNDEVIAWVKEAQQEFDSAKRADIYSKIQRQIAEDVVVASLFHQSYPYAFSSKVQGFYLLSTSSYRLWEVWLAE